ncbi:hypothetical protein tb265_30970 [Gemmatimonadetes bacterium T265]|nr:hypothetical protein tb265_30970 [Gemmatimonadetes bacterium T265]
MSPHTRPTHAWAVRAVAGAVLGLVATAAGASAQVLHARTGPENPLLLRADSPGGTYSPSDPSLRNYYGATMDGVNLDGIGVIQTADPSTPGLYATCTAERIGLRALITAAHCVTDENTGTVFSTHDNPTSVHFIGPGAGGVGSKYYSYTSSATFVQSTFHGFYNSTTMAYQDVAVLLFDNPLPSFITTYGLYDTGPLGSEDPMGQNTVNAGTGTFGSGTGPTGFDFRRRAGDNVVDFVGNDPNANDFGDLYTSFEDQYDRYNSTCYVFGICYPSRGATEAGIASGDSGGPLFINGELAGVTSFSTYFCDPTVTTKCVPLVADPSRPFNSYGALNAFAPVWANSAFIADAIAAPEPTTVALVGFGMAGVGLAARRRRQS